MSAVTVLDAPPKVVRRKGAPMKTPKPSMPTKSNPYPKQRTKKVPKKKT